MDESRNAQVVKDAYAAFGRGDIPAILAMLDDNVAWHALKGAEGVAPQAGIRRGKASVTQFFTILASTTEFTVFEPREFIAQGDKVAVVGYYEVNVKTTGRSVASDWVMVFTLVNGRITEFREWTDSAQVVRAYAQIAAV
jgi:ketosteroid isomerase-like protein